MKSNHGKGDQSFDKSPSKRPERDSSHSPRGEEAKNGGDSEEDEFFDALED